MMFQTRIHPRVCAWGTILTALLAATAAVAQPFPAQSMMGKLEWRSVGPYIGGRVVAVAGVPDKPDLFYMGAVDGGIWKSTNYGVSWKNISDGWPSTSDSIGALAVAPSNPKVIYAGTGESDIRGDMITGDGVFKSTDAGKTWRYAGLRDTHTTMDLIVDPKNPDVVYAASMGHVFVAGPNRGVFKTTDGGKTWHKVLFINDKTGVVDLAMDPANPDVLYAAAWQAYRTPWHLDSGGPGSGLYKTTDGGAHWTDITRNPGLPKGVLGKIGVAVAPSNPDVVYLTIQAKHGGVFKSTDGGKNFKRVNKEWKLRQRAFYYMAIFVDPKDPDTVYMPQVDALFVSHDGGKSFKKLHTPHGDNHIVWINPRNTDILLEGNDGGATVSTDRGKTWSTEHNQPTGQYYTVSLDDRFPFHMYGSQQDEGSFEGPSATPEGKIPLSAWKRVAYGESTFVAPQPGNPDVTFGSGYFSILLSHDAVTGQLQSVSPWPLYQEGASSGELKYRFAWTHPILFSPADPHELLVGSQYVMTSEDLGRTWKTISPDLTRNEASTEVPTGGPVDLDQSGAEIFPYVAALAVSPLDGKEIWAGSSDGLVHVTTDGGAHWSAVRPPALPDWSRISAIEPSHTDKGTAWLTASRYMWDDFRPYVYKTTDYGRHWTAVTDGLPADQYVLALRQDPNDPNLLFVGTRNSVYVSFDGGAHWQPLKLNLPHVQVRALAIDSRQGALVAATHGRGFWVLDNLALLEQLAAHPQHASDAAALFAPQQAWLSHAYGKPDEPRAAKAAGRNPPFGATVFFHVPQNYDGKTPVTLTFAKSDGTVVRSFDLHLKAKGGKQKKIDESNLSPAARKARAERRLTAIEPGMNRFQWNLRYPDATEVKGFYVPVAAGGLPDEVSGPVVVPGTYRVTLDYGGKKISQDFTVALDPRIKADPSDLAARLALQMQVHTTLDTLDKAINKAIEARDRIEKRAAGHGAAGASKVDALDHAIDALVQLKVQSSEGTLLHEARLRSHLAYLQANIGLAYARPTQAQYAVYKDLAQQAKAGEDRIDAALATAKTK
ncbi:MAG: exo-alpha-sialidase [Xanthomonadaceae bacterium]|nr:exo-alpha-sialidase [Xanthomonadaceae bacterium]